MTGQYSARDFDWALVLLSLSLVALGVIEIYSATRATAWQDSHNRQLAWIGLGLLVLWLVSMIDYGWLVEHAPVFYVAGMLALLVVALLAEPVAGARRWLPLLGGASIQISELVKVVLVLLMARFFSKLGPERPSLGNLAKIVGLFVLPAALVAKQPDLSTALTYMSILAVGIFVAGVNWRYVAVAGLAAVLLLPIGWQYLEPYQRDRITTFLDPEQDPRGTGYQPIHPVAFLAGAAHRLYFFGLRRGDWLCRGCSGAGALFRHADAHRQ
jgi:rod shape determining protein RodA